MLISLFALFTGFVIDAVIGDPHGFPHPIVLIGKLIAALEKLLRGAFPKTKKGELWAGTVLVISVTVLCAGVPFLLLYAAGRISPWLRFALESIMCWQIIAAKSLRDESMKVYRSLKKGDREQARRDVSMIVGRDTAVLDEAGITRAAVETVAENASDGVIAPMLYLALGGAWAGFLYKGINTMDSMVAYKNEKYLYFGRAAAYLDDVANYLPSRLCALLMIAGSLFTGGSVGNAARIWRRDRRKHASPNSAQTESVCAGALGIRLAGDAVYGGVVHQKEYIGDDLRPVEYEDIRRANALMYAAAILALVLFCAVKAGIIAALGGFVC